MQRLRRPIALVSFALFLGCSGCSGADDGNRGEPILVAHGLGISWDWLSHRISVLELALEGGEADVAETVVVAENHGGTYGALDMPYARYDSQRVESGALAHELASVTVEIPPGATLGTDDFAAAVETSMPAGSLRGADAVAAFVRGYRIDTDRYDSPPAFETDPALPYDPSHGFTTLGYGVGVSSPVLDGDVVRFTVRARNGLGASDRGDMNAAIPTASSWVRVDVLLVGAFGARAAVTRGSVAYTLDDMTFGDHTLPPHASLDDQTLVLAGEAGPERAFVGVSAFEFYINTPGHHAATCTVTQDAINYWGEMISGPGRYLREATAVLDGFTYEPGTGMASVAFDLFATNTSGSYEEGTVCFEGRGEVTLVQFDDPDGSLGGWISTMFGHVTDEITREPIVAP